MIFPKLDNERCTPETGLRIAIQVPNTHVQKIVDAVLVGNALSYGD